MYLVWAFDKVPKDTCSDMEPTGSIFFPPKPYNDFDASFHYFLMKPISSEVERNSIFARLPFSTRTLMTFYLSMCAIITIASVCEKDVNLMSASVKVV
jgi:hypothetical protein